MPYTPPSSDKKNVSEKANELFEAVVDQEITNIQKIISTYKARPLETSGLMLGRRDSFIRFMFREDLVDSISRIKRVEAIYHSLNNPDRVNKKREFEDFKDKVKRVKLGYL